MTLFKKAVLLVCLLGFAALLAGCSTKGPKQSSIPWSQPAGWEGQIPGMGSPAGR